MFLKTSSQKRKLSDMSVKIDLKSEVNKTEKQNQIISDSENNALFHNIKTNFEIIKKQNEVQNSKSGNIQEVETILFDWVKSLYNTDNRVPDKLIKAKAFLIANSMGCHKFNANSMWLHKFKQKYYFGLKQNHLEFDNFNKDYEEWRSKDLFKLLLSYDEQDVFCAYETGLFYKCLPDEIKQFQDGKCSHGEYSDERITVLLGVNICGTDKLKPLVIGDAKISKYFFSQKLPVTYWCNVKAWMTSEIFENWVTNLDKKFHIQKRKILLFVEKCPTHPNITTQLKSIRIEYFPAVMKPELQPMIHIINNMKGIYRKTLLEATLLKLKQRKPTQITILDAMMNLSNVWKMDVLKSTIKQCFVKSGFAKSFENKRDVEIIPIEMKPALNKYCKKTEMDPLSIEEYLYVDANLRVAENECNEQNEDFEELSEYKSIQDLSSIEDDSETEHLSETELRQFFDKIHNYLQVNMNKEAYNALTILENYFDNGPNFEPPKKKLKLDV